MSHVFWFKSSIRCNYMHGLGPDCVNELFCINICTITSQHGAYDETVNKAILTNMFPSGILVYRLVWLNNYAEKARSILLLNLSNNEFGAP